MFHEKNDIEFFICYFNRFTPVELAFLAEYAKTMNLVAKALDERRMCKWGGGLLEFQ